MRWTFPRVNLRTIARAAYQELAERIGEEEAAWPCLPSAIQNRLLLFIP